jgi:pilus assembly protein Flp/PilA
MRNIMSPFKTFIADESGVTAIEYALIAAVVGIAVIAGANLLSDGLTSLFNSVADMLSNSAAGFK